MSLAHVVPNRVVLEGSRGFFASKMIFLLKMPLYTAGMLVHTWSSGKPRSAVVQSTHHCKIVKGFT